MALSQMELALIQRAGVVSKQALEVLKPVIDEIDSVWNAAGGPGSTVSQADLNAAAQLSGLTTAQLADGIFALTSTLKTAIASGYAAMAQLGARAS